MDADIEVIVEEEPEIVVEVIEAKLKPEQVGHVTPGWEPKTVTPDEGCVFSRMEVDGMPEPTEVAVITENGDHHVEQAGIARVQVPIPPGYIIPSGKRVFTENGTDIDVRELESVDIVVPVPVMPDEYATGGSFTDKTAKSVYLNRSLTAIGNNVFSGFSALESVDMPDSVSGIGSYAFWNCTKLSGVKLPTQLETIDNNAFGKCSELMLVNGLPSTLQSVGASAFGGCSKLNFTSFPSGITTIGARAFEGCAALTITELPPIQIIKNDTFSGCKSIQMLSIPATITTIEGYSFFLCTGLTSVRFLGTPSSIAANAFGGCANLLNIYVPWPEGTVAGAPWGATNATITYDYTGG